MPFEILKQRFNPNIAAKSKSQLAVCLPGIRAWSTYPNKQKQKNMGIKYAKASADGSQIIFSAADSAGRNVESLLNNGFLPLMEEALPDAPLGDFECYEPRYRVEEECVVKYFELVADAPSLIARRIEELMAQLDESDYRVVKSYEMAMVGKSSPYDIEALHAERSALRSEVQALRARLR